MMVPRMTEEKAIEEIEVPKKKLNAKEKQEQHISRIKKTAIACFIGIIVGGPLVFNCSSNKPCGI